MIIQASTITVPGAPPLPGLAFRHFRGETDFSAIAAILESCREADQLDRVDTVEDIAKFYAHLSNCDPAQDVLFAEVNDQPIGYQRVTWVTESEGDQIYMHYGILSPAWRRRGIGRAMLHAAEARLRQIGSSHEITGPRLLQAFVSETEIGTNAMLRAEGYQAIRYGFQMVRPLSEPIPAGILPDGIEVRPIAPDQYRSVWLAADEAFRDEWGYSPRTDEDYRLWLEARWTQPALWRVAWDGDQIVGMVLNYIDAEENRVHNRSRGYTESISVRRPWRKRGIATALLLQSLALLRDMGFQEAALGVDAENPSGALRVYEGVGFRLVRKFSVYRKPLEAEPSPHV
ncbi:MAG: GNAT family N-acetyltransferase [Anaerolineales bacterium]